MSDDRVETHVGRDRPDDAGAASARDPLPGVVAAPPRRDPGAPFVSVGADGRAGPRPACSRRSPPPTSSCCRRPTRSSRSAPILAVPGLRDAIRRAAGRRRLADRRRRAGARHGRRVPGRDRRRDLRGRRRRALRRARSDGGLLDGWIVDDDRRRASSTTSRRSGIRPRAVPAMMRDVPTAAALAADVGLAARRTRRGHDRDRADSRHPDVRVLICAVPGFPKSPPATTWPALIADALTAPGAPLATATSSSSPARSSARPRAGWSAAPTARRRSTTRPCASSRAAGRCASSRPGTAS